MKLKLFLTGLLVVSSCLFLGAKPSFPPLIASSQQVEIDLHAPTAILIEFQSGTIIYQKNATERFYPASMTKMMGMLLVIEHIQAGKMAFTDIITTSPYAAGMGGTQIFLQPGETMSVEDLFKSVAINSANDAIVALGEAVSGSNEEFVKAMNKRASQLQMKNTNFVNPTGFHHVDHYSSSYDMALLARELLKYEDIVIPHSSQFDGYIRQDSANPFWLVNTNKLVKHYQGMDGLKTGYTSDSLYCLTATAKRDNQRFISVVMNEASIANRSQDTIKLLDYGFANFHSLVLHKSKEVITKYDFAHARAKQTEIVVAQEVRVSLPKGEKFDSLKINVVISKLDAGAKSKDVVGSLEIINSLNWKFTFDLIVLESVPRANWFDMFMTTLKSIFLSN